jgi:hypothetical protein
MSPQQTNLTSETGRDASGLRLDLAIALVKDASGNALAEACPDASIAALRDAFLEKEAAGPPVASTRSVLSLLQGYWRAFRKRRQRERLLVSLHDLSDRELMDKLLQRRKAAPQARFLGAHPNLEVTPAAVDRHRVGALP